MSKNNSVPSMCHEPNSLDRAKAARTNNRPRKQSGEKQTAQQNNLAEQTGYLLVHSRRLCTYRAALMLLLEALQTRPDWCDSSPPKVITIVRHDKTSGLTFTDFSKEQREGFRRALKYAYAVLRLPLDRCAIAEAQQILTIPRAEPASAPFSSPPRYRKKNASVSRNATESITP